MPSLEGGWWQGMFQIKFEFDSWLKLNSTGWVRWNPETDGIWGTLRGCNSGMHDWSSIFPHCFKSLYDFDLRYEVTECTTKLLPIILIKRYWDTLQLESKVFVKFVSSQNSDLFVWSTVCDLGSRSRMHTSNLWGVMTAWSWRATSIRLKTFQPKNRWASQLLALKKLRRWSIQLTWQSLSTNSHLQCFLFLFKYCST